MDLKSDLSSSVNSLTHEITSFCNEPVLAQDTSLYVSISVLPWGQQEVGAALAREVEAEPASCQTNVSYRLHIAQSEKTPGVESKYAGDKIGVCVSYPYYRETGKN